jgi:hypothetical protein
MNALCAANFPHLDLQASQAGLYRAGSVVEPNPGCLGHVIRRCYLEL